MTSREILEDVIERLTTQMKLANATLKSTRQESRQTQESLETLEKEHKRVVQQIGELKKRESELISERDEARELAKKALEKVSEMESKQHVHRGSGQSATPARVKSVKPEKFSGSGNDTDFQAFLDQFEVCARMNGWNEEEKANQLILCMKEKARVVMCQLSSNDKSSYESMVKALRKKIGMRQVPEAAKATAQGQTKEGGRNFVRFKH